MIINNYIIQNIFYIDTSDTTTVYFYLINKYIYVGKNL